MGTDFCRYGLGDSTTLGIDIEKRFQGMEMPHKVKMAVSGCPRNCAEATVKDVGVVAVEGGKWEIYVGGAAGANVRKGDVLCIADTPADVIKYIGRFVQYYRENAKYLERTYGFVERIGVERLRQILMDDGDGAARRLDDDLQASVDAYFDPWQRRRQARPQKPVRERPRRRIAHVCRIGHTGMRRVQMTKTQKIEKTYRIGALENIPLGEGRIARVGHMPIAVFRARSGEVFATQALCPHRAGPLGGWHHRRRRAPLPAARLQIRLGYRRPH